MTNIIEEIKRTCSDIFSDRLFFQSYHRTFIISGSDLSQALNNHNGNYNEITVCRWFDNFWLYLEINFIEQPIESKLAKKWSRKDYLEMLSTKYLKINQFFFNVTISLSVFQGGYQKEEKKQLFRAEWDNYDGISVHPQPHWHFYPDNEDNDDFDNEDDFLDELEVVEPVIDIKRMHFAMNGQWAQNGDFIHRINDSVAIVNWLNGTLRHIKHQLLYSK